MQLYTTVIFLTVILEDTASALQRSELFIFGDGVGDQNPFRNDDDNSLGNVPAVPYRFFGIQRSTLYINNNGIVTFTDLLQRFSNNPFPLTVGYQTVAVFFGDVDTRGSGELFFRVTSNERDLQRVDNVIHAGFVREAGFASRSVIVVTWDNVGHYNQATDQLNTFQCVIATDGTDTFVVFLYVDIQWTRASTNHNHAQVGFDAGDGVNFYILPGSDTAAGLRNLMDTSNVGVPGMWLFKVSGPSVEMGPCTSGPGGAGIFPTILTPDFSDQLGGNRVSVEGPCFFESDNVTCEFDGQLTATQYQSGLTVECLTPFFPQPGHVAFRLLIDGDVRGEANFTAILAQTPGDYDPECRTGENEKNLPAEWKILLDTHDYINLYDENGITRPAWITNDVDGDSLGWEQVKGGECARTIRSCTNLASQNNWLLSQLISYEDALEIFFKVTFQFNGCFFRPSCTRPYMTLYSYHRDAVAHEADRINPTNYQPLFGTVEASRLEQPAGSNFVINQTHALIRPANSSRFYLGVRDEGTCGNIDRLVVYYMICPARQEGLVYYPEFAVPVRGSSDDMFASSCATNAHNITTLQVIAFGGNSSCSPVAPGGAMCECDEGYVPSENGTACEACSSGTYQSNATCEPCPANTVTDHVMPVTECSCISGFYRSAAQQEGPEVGCTEPPSACTDIEVTLTTPTSFSVTWSRPETTGRSDFFYRVLHSNPNVVGEFILENDNLADSGSTMNYNITGLHPFTSYTVRVTTHNGVSDQDPNTHLRQCEVSAMTEEGVPPGLPSSVEQLCTTIVWHEPEQPNGIIRGYDIVFSSAPLVIRRNVSWFVTDENQREPAVTVQVRAINGAGEGAYTPPKLVCPQLCVLDPLATSQTNTSITIEWRRPTFSGDISYRIDLNDPSESEEFREVTSSIANTGERLMYVVTELDPFKTYRVNVTASSAREEAVCQTVARTEEGVPSAPSSLVAYDRVVVWQTPLQPNGIITGYDIRFGMGAIRSFGPEVNRYTPSNQDRADNITIQIRANTNAGPGLWTQPIYLGGMIELTESTELATDEVGLELAEINRREFTTYLLAVSFATAAVTAVLVALVYAVACYARPPSRIHSEPHHKEVKK